MQNSRDRLIELIQSAVDGCARHWAEKIADYLIENGVIAIPVHETLSITDTAIGIFEKWNDVTGAVANGTSWYYELQSVIEDIVKLSFGAGIMYREEVEEALERSKGNA